MSLLMVFAFLGQIFTSSANVKVEKDINYGSSTNDPNRQLNVYYPADVATTKEVLIFIHGGSWSSGKKETYWWLGRNFARKGVVTVIVNYRLAPNAEFHQMGLDCAEAVKWVYANIGRYGGDLRKIFVMGHSAGGHLAELINADPQYFNSVGLKNPIKGVILNDAFGLDMHEYLNIAEKDDSYRDFLRTFSTHPETWTLGSPLHYIENIRNPQLIFYGARTYPAIQIQSKRLDSLLLAKQVKTELHVIKHKKHVGMISQMIFGANQLYQIILNFMKVN
ncbi:alpha/beta hydrolase [Pedobacter sp. MC2016-24]|nr:alpha/beta hydrolase [Pedobacter sp. MC2016-24]